MVRCSVDRKESLRGATSASRAGRSVHSEQRAAGQQREYSGVDQRFDHFLPPALRVVEAIAGLQLLEYEFDFPASAIGASDVLGGEEVASDARRVAVIRSFLGITDGEEAKALSRRRAFAAVAAGLGTDLDLHIQDSAPGTGQHGLQRLLDDARRCSTSLVPSAGEPLRTRTIVGSASSLTRVRKRPPARTMFLNSWKW